MRKFLQSLIFILFTNFMAFCQIPSGNLVGWYLADSVVVESGLVATWTDYSGNNFNLTQSNVTLRPIQVNNVLNGHSVIRFDGLNDYMSVDFGQTFAQPNTIFVVWKANGLTANQFAFDGLNTSYRTSISATSSSIRLNSGTNLTFPSTLPFLQYRLNTSLFKSTTSLVKENGIQMSIGDGGSLSCIGLKIGIAFNNTAPLQGDIVEIIYYHRILNNDEVLLVENYLMDKYTVPLDIGPDIFRSNFCDTIIYVNSSYNNILWSTGETNDTIFVNQSGQYWVQATDIFGRLQYDTINIEFPNPNFQNSSICPGDSVLYEPILAGIFDYLWSDTGTESSKYFKDAGDYWLRIEDTFGCFDTVFFSVAVDSFKNHISLGNDTSLCSGNTIRLIEGEEVCSSFFWTTNGNVTPVQTVNESGWQKIEVENANGCEASDSIYVTIVGSAPTPGYFVENLCLGETTLFIDNSTPQADIASWKWIINGNDTLFTQNAEWVFENVGTQNIELIVEAFSGCENSFDFEIEILETPSVSFANYPACNEVELSFIPEYTIPVNTEVSVFNWYVDGVLQSNSENFAYTFSSADSYNVLFILEIDNGCQSSINHEITVLDLYDLPTGVSLVSPTDNALTSDRQFNFSWNPCTEAIFYKIQFSLDYYFSEIIFESENIYNSTFEYIFEDNYDTIFWRVLAFNPCHIFVYSDISQISFFNSTIFPKLKVWLSSDYGVNATDNYVDQWLDRSPNGNMLTQSSSTNKPLLVDSVINNLPTLRFDGTNDFMDFQTNILQSDAIFSYFFICKNTKTTNNSTIFSQYIASQNGRTLLIFNFEGLGKFTHFINPGTNANQSITSNNFSIISATNNGIANNLKLYVNNMPVANGSATSTLNVNSQIGGQQLGGYFKGDIAEIIFYDTVLLDNDRQMVERYLHDKYFPPVNLGYDIRVPYGFCDTAITTAYKPWFTSYSWSTGETDSIIHVNRPGVYSVTVTDIFGFESSDDIRVYYPPVNDFADTVVCFGNSVVWDAQIFGDYTYSWYGSGETTQQITITDEGNYAVIVYDTLGCQYLSDTISFSFDNYEFTASVGPADTALCSGNRIMLVTNRPETVSYLWSTGSTTPEIVLSETGTYSVTTTNWRGCEASDEIDVTITGTVPVPLFSSEGHCAQNPVYFTDNSTSVDGTINYWSWVLNGLEFSNAQNPEITIDEPGTYPVTLSIRTDADCGDFVNTNLTIYPLPSVSFVPDYFCQFAPVDFVSTAQVEGGTVSENMWDFSGIELFGTNVSHTFVQSGNNSVKLTSTSDVGCLDSLVTEVYVKNSSLPVFSTENACEGSDIYFVNNTEVLAHNLPLEWNWDFGDGNTGTGSDPAHIYENAGIYDVSVNVVWQNMCEVPATAQVEVYNNPSLSLLAEDECINVPFSVQKTVESLSGEVVSYNWTFGSVNQQISASENPQFSSSVPGEYLVTLSIETEYGCATNAVDTVIVHANPLASFAASRVWGAVPMEVEFTNNSEGASTYLWSFGDSGISSDEDPVYIYNSEGEFDIVLQSYSQFGCVDDTTIRIKTVIPVLDVILYDLRTVMSGNYLQTNVYVINNGTLPVYNAEITLDLGDGQLYREIIEYIAPSQVLDYKFSMEAYRADGKLPEVVCSEIYAPAFEGYAEINTDDNVLCNTDVNNLRVYQPYPNPATGELNVSFILESESDVTITFVNSIGEQVYKNNISNKTGYQKLLVDVSNFIPGVYYLQISAGDEVRSFKVEVL